MIKYKKIDNYNKNDIDINAIINNDYIIIYEIEFMNFFHLLDLRDYSSENDEIED